MRTFVIGTAGHIDHGKSALIRALTGTDPDRLAEEKQRGITIDLGFAQLELGEDLQAGVVDVPGHERFVKNMVAGTGGIDLVLMVVAADEGVMPQTREHLDICSLLGIEHGVVALTKIDLVDEPDWLDLVTEDIRSELDGTFLADAPIVPVSARSEQGLEALRSELVRTAAAIEPRSSSGPAMLAIDRAFSMRGFGSVVTGTLFSGQLEVEDAVDVVPDASGKLTGLKVRGLQSHNRSLERAAAGQRLAVNLSGVDKSWLHRGQVLVHSGSLQAGSELEAVLELLPGAKPLKSRKRLLFHTGTQKVSAAMRLVGRQQLEPGGRCYVRVLCEEPVATLPGQHFILRGFAPIAQRGTTIGGGRILAVLPPRRSRRQLDHWVAELEVLDAGSLAERLTVQLDRAGSRGLNVAEMAMHTGAGPRQVRRELERLLAERRVFKYDREGDRYASAAEIERLAERAHDRLATFHQANPLLPGMPAEQLRGSLDAPVGPKLFRLLLAELGRAGQARAEADRVRLAEHEVRLGAADTQLEQQLIGLFREAGLTPPRLGEAAERLDRPTGAVESLLRHLSRTGTLTHLTGDLYIHNAPLQELEQKLVAHLEQNESIDTQTFKKMVGASRKHVIPLAEYFDRQKVTIRVGDRRVLRGQGRSAGPKSSRPKDGG